MCFLLVLSKRLLSYGFLLLTHNAYLCSGYICRSNPQAIFFPFCSNILIIRCGNVNWAKRLKCNICNTNKPGQNEGGVRYGSMQ